MMPQDPKFVSLVRDLIEDKDADAIGPDWGQDRILEWLAETYNSLQQTAVLYQVARNHHHARCKHAVGRLGVAEGETVISAGLSFCVRKGVVYVGTAENPVTVETIDAARAEAVRRMIARGKLPPLDPAGQAD
jgi:hypothetical protein